MQRRPPALGTAGPDEEPTGFPDGRPHEEQPRWRKDFPIDTPEDTYISRRDFTRFMVLTSGAFVAGHAWIALEAATASRREDTERAIARLSELPVGTARSFHYPSDGDPCLLVRLSESEVVAFSQLCTHLSCAVQPDVAGGHFVCPCHEALFDLRDGAPVKGPPRRPLPRIKLEVRGDTVYATGVELRV